VRGRTFCAYFPKENPLMSRSMHISIENGDPVTGKVVLEDGTELQKLLMIDGIHIDINVRQRPVVTLTCRPSKLTIDLADAKLRFEERDEHSINGD
jgi:hypothetical protein